MLVNCTPPPVSVTGFSMGSGASTLPERPVFPRSSVLSASGASPLPLTVSMAQVMTQARPSSASTTSTRRSPRCAERHRRRERVSFRNSRELAMPASF